MFKVNWLIIIFLFFLITLRHFLKDLPPVLLIVLSVKLQMHALLLNCHTFTSFAIDEMDHLVFSISMLPSRYSSSYRKISFLKKSSMRILLPVCTLYYKRRPILRKQRNNFHDNWTSSHNKIIRVVCGLQQFEQKILYPFLIISLNRLFVRIDMWV